MLVFLCTSVNLFRNMSSLTVRLLQQGLHRSPCIDYQTVPEETANKYHTRVSVEIGMKNQHTYDPLDQSIRKELFNVFTAVMIFIRTKIFEKYHHRNIMFVHGRLSKGFGEIAMKNLPVKYCKNSHTVVMYYFGKYSSE